ncbi:unnamed protein product [Linum tenue]|uniref:Amino acid transporter transmembrane domain-containing protein n=1 Tax=Linum tenue TaxID=586396 RepID=A0AAV0JH12_9ROSI|nr:unnamed protein product [Linum tenue]
MADPPKPESSGRQDAGASFVLESKGQWWHAGYHLTTAIVGPTILTLPYAFRGLGWVPGIFSLTAMGVVSFYSYYLMSLVLDFCEKDGRRHIRFRELAADVLGSGWMFYFVISIQTAINTGISIGTLLLSGECLQIMYKDLSPNGSMELWQFIAMVTGVMMVLSQMPSFHSLRHINLASLLLSFGYTFLVVAASIYAGMSKHAPSRDYSLESAPSHRVFSAFTSISIIASIFGNGILPEIQVYSQVAFEVMEKKSADPNRGMFSMRNLIPRIVLRSLYMGICGLLAAMLPFFGDINGIVGALGFIPLDFILPMLLYNMTYRPSKSSVMYWMNIAIMFVFTGVGLLGAFSSVRKLVLDADKFKLFSSDVVD